MSLAAVLCAVPGFVPPRAQDSASGFNPLSGDAAAIERGKQLFRAEAVCGTCHGMNANGGGRGAPNAANLQKFKRGYKAFVRSVKEGYKTMPAWGGGIVLTDEQINQIGAWLETLAKPGANWKEGEL